MSDNNTSNNEGCGCGTLMLGAWLMVIVFQITGDISWPWWVILFPIWFPLALLAAGAIVETITR